MRKSYRGIQNLRSWKLWYEKATWIEDDKTIKITVPLNGVLKKGTLRQIIKESGLSMDEFFAIAQSIKA